MSTKPKKVKKWGITLVLILFALIMIGVIFIIDINLPLGVAIGVAYTIVILYSWLLPGTFSSVYVALVCTFFVIMGFYYSPHLDTPNHIWGINRLMSIVIIWLSASLVAIAKSSFKGLEDARNTLEKRVEERTMDLMKSEERFRLMIQDIQSYSILLLSPEGIIENWNIGAQKIKGYGAEEIIGKSYNVFFTEESQKNGMPEKLLEIAAEKGRVQDEGWWMKKDGSLFWTNLTLTSILDDDGNIIGFSTLTRDLTERKQVQEMQKAKAILEAKNEELGQFAYIASHDLQEPLVTVKGYLSLLEEDYHEQFDEDGKFYLNTISSAIYRMSNLVKDLLDYSRIGKQKELVEENTEEIAKIVVKDLAAQIKETGAQISFGKLPTIFVYSTEFRQLLQNLISNGIKFQQKGNQPVIAIKAERQNNFWRFEVTDNGIGISKEQEQKIFMIFKRLHSKSSYEGTGIGLATCQKIAELHGGEIGVNSTIGVGSTFYFTIPVHVSDILVVD